MAFYYQQKFTPKLKEIKQKKAIANSLSNYFKNITKLLNIPEWKPEETTNNTDLEIF